MGRDEGAIWLIGMMGAGKSTVGRALAERLSWRFVDLDERIAAEAGHTVAELFASEGEAAFRDREVDAVLRLAADCDRTVVASGGGTPCQPAALAAMRNSGRIVWLRTTIDELLPTLNAAARPLLAGSTDRDGLRATLVSLEQQRAEVYRTADEIIDREGRDSASIVNEILERLSQ